MSKAFDKLQVYLDKAYAYRTALSMMHWDNSTTAPKEAIEYTSKAMGILAVEDYNNLINDDVKAILEELSLEEEQALLSTNEKAIVKNMKKQFKDLEAIPVNEYEEYQMLTAQAAPIWEQAKTEKDYSILAPTLEKIFAYNKKFAGYKQKEGQKLYDVLLDDYEEGFTVEILDEFFGKLREALLPLVQAIREKKDFINQGFLHESYDIETQKKLSRFIAEYIGFDFNRGTIGESEHPYTLNFHNRDVRFTNHYHENKMEDAIFSAVHEGGHALYEMGIADDITLTPVGGGASMGMHESQSRFYENNIGRSREFWVPLFDKVKAFFPEQLGEITAEEFYRAINYSYPRFIRTEADELTYPFHVMIRYEIEKMYFDGNVEVKDLAKVWNEKYEEYLGITPENDAVGVLQDMHWSGGMLGYFPSYALGSAIAAQLFHHMESVMPVREYLTKGNLVPIREFLKEHIHQYGMTKTTQEMLKETTGEGFNPDYYIEYLTKKYTELYEL